MKRSDLDEAVPCEICATMVTRRNLNRHLRDRHGDASAHRQTSVTSRSSSLDASTVAATTSMAPCSTNDMMKAAVDALDQHHSFSEMHLTEYIRQCYPDVSERDRRGLMIGAVAGAQHASRLHFVVQTNQSSEDPAKRQMAAKAASGMSFWNMGLRKPPRVAQPVRISEAAPTADNEVQQTSTMWAPVTPHAILDTVVAREIACGGFDFLTTAVMEAAIGHGVNGDAGDMLLFADLRPPAPPYQVAVMGKRLH